MTSRWVSRIVHVERTPRGYVWVLSCDHVEKKESRPRDGQELARCGACARRGRKAPSAVCPELRELRALLLKREEEGVKEGVGGERSGERPIVVLPPAVGAGRRGRGRGKEGTMVRAKARASLVLGKEEPAALVKSASTRAFPLVLPLLRGELEPEVRTMEDGSVRLLSFEWASELSDGAES